MLQQHFLNEAPFTLMASTLLCIGYGRSQTTKPAPVDIQKANELYKKAFSREEPYIIISLLEEMSLLAHLIDWNTRKPLSGELITSFSSSSTPSLPHYLCYPTMNGWGRGGMDIFEPYPFPWIVPKNHVFVMGDNRDHSSDSRYWGFVPYDRIKGRASFIWLSIDHHDASSFLGWGVRWERIFTWMHQLYD